ncbi:MAG TPA: ABC transporter permease subunit [Phototrophicaceae bacterium]|nr:ABC transporter permease subunit [Phototrophicaceae bacterium]
MTTNQTTSQTVVAAPPAVVVHPSEEAVLVALAKRKRNKQVGLIVSYVILVLAVIFAIYPVYFAFLVSIRPNGQLLSLNLGDMFAPITGVSFDAYNKILNGGVNMPFWNWLGNSLLVSALTAIAALLLATSGAFTISRFKFRGRSALLILFLAIQAFPGVLALNAISNLLTKLGLYGSPFGLILAYSAGTIVFCTWNLKGYFDTIPVEIEEAALIDGCNTFQSFFLVLLPLSIPAIAITAFFGFLAGWGEFALASAIVPAPAQRQTLPVALNVLANSKSVPWSEFAAASMLIAIPTMLLFLFMQRYLQSGLTAGGVKG